MLLSLVSIDLDWRPNRGGPLGETAAGLLQTCFGYQAYVVVIMTAAIGLRAWVALGWLAILREAAGGSIVVLALSAGSGFLNTPGVQPGGTAGAAIAAGLGSYVSVGGGFIVVILALVGGLALMFQRAPTDLMAALAGAAGIGSRTGASKATDSASSVITEMSKDDVSLNSSREPIKVALAANGARTDLPLVRKAEVSKPIVRDPAPKAPARGKGGYKLPPVTLLDVPPVEHSQIDEAALERSARVLEQKLGDFGVAGRVVEVQPGPVVTMYKLEPGSGIKVSQIVNLADDLSMALRAATVRIQAPVPGEAVVGIEVPNRKREKIYLREILEAEEFGAAQSHLTIALGKDIAGRPAAADLATMPHLLIAGATGTGKSVSIHTMISSILFSATADDVRFILIDPKMLELSVYEGIPHLLVPVVVDPEKAAAALLWATQEMEGRYRMMRELGGAQYRWLQPRDRQWWRVGRAQARRCGG